MSQHRAHATSGGGGLQRVYGQWRYAILFYSLLLTLAVGPLRNALGFRVSLLELFLAINLLAAVVPIEDLDLLESLEDASDLDEVRAALADPANRERVGWEELKARLAL